MRLCIYSKIAYHFHIFGPQIPHGYPCTDGSLLHAKFHPIGATYHSYGARNITTAPLVTEIHIGVCSAANNTK